MQLVVNLDPTLSEVLSEVRYLTRPPLSLRLPTALRQLTKNTDYSELKHRQTILQVSAQSAMMGNICKPWVLYIVQSVYSEELTQLSSPFKENLGSALIKTKK